MAGKRVSTPLPRTAFDLEPGKLWVMHCAEGPVPLAAAEAVREFLRRETRPWNLRWEEDFLGLPRRVREEAARLLGARAADLTLTQTTTTGLATVAQGYPWRPGDEVVVPLGEFPSNTWPWKSLADRGVRFREVSLWNGHAAGARAWESLPPPITADPETRLLEALGPRTRVLSVSWVRFQDGLVLDLSRLARGCRELGVHLVVDGIQGAGTLPLDLRDLGRQGVAAFASGGHKGLLAPQGLALLWTQEGFRQELAPPGGWLSVEGATDFTRPSTDLDRGWAQDGSRLEAGVPNLVGCAALAASLGVLNEAGAASIAAHLDGLARSFLAGLQEVPGWERPAERLELLRQRWRVGSILGLHHSGTGAEALQKILEAGMRRGIYASVREGYLRIAFHGWHSEDDSGVLLDWLSSADTKPR